MLAPAGTDTARANIQDLCLPDAVFEGIESAWRTMETSLPSDAVLNFKRMAADLSRLAHGRTPEIRQRIFGALEMMAEVAGIDPDSAQQVMSVAVKASALPATGAPPLAPDQIDLAATFTFIGDAPSAPPRELIKGLLPASGVAITGGQSSAGKTFTEMHKAVCLATTTPFFGHRIVEKVGTAFVAAEGRAFIPNRFAAALAKHSITEKLPIVWPKLLPDFSSSDGIKLFVRQLLELDKHYKNEFGVRLGNVVIDTVAACFSMKSEDDNAEATKICNVMRTIGEEVGALMSPIHHYGKSLDSGLRGASAWKGSADLILGVLADIDPLTGRASNRELVCCKARDGEQGPLSPFSLEFVKLGVDEDGDVYGSCCVVPADGKSRQGNIAKLNKGARAIQDAITEVMNSAAKTITPRAGMLPVRAVKVIDVRPEFDLRYVVDEADPIKAADAKRKAFRRAMDYLPTSQFCSGSAEGADWIWKA
jgi:hypothetical protein